MPKSGYLRIRTSSDILRVLINLRKGHSYCKYCIFFPSYFIEFFDEAGGDDGQHQTGNQLQDKAIQPHIEGEDGLVDDLKQKHFNIMSPAMDTKISNLAREECDT